VELGARHAEHTVDGDGWWCPCGFSLIQVKKEASLGYVYIGSRADRYGLEWVPGKLLPRRPVF